jgi:hypothetical protein
MMGMGVTENAWVGEREGKDRGVYGGTLRIIPCNHSFTCPFGQASYL